MSKIEIVGAKLVGGLFCHYKFREDIGKGRHDTVTIKSERPIHEDLLKCFQALAIHLPVILQDVKPEEVEDINSDVNNYRGSDRFKELLEKFTVIEVEREIEESRATLKGTKVLDLGVLGIDTPMIRYEGNYHFKLEFQFAIDKLMHEVQLYRDGKQAPEIVQPELFTDADEDKPEKAKRGRKKKSILEGTTVTMSAGGKSVTIDGETFEQRMDDLGSRINELGGTRVDHGELTDDEFNQPTTAFKIDAADVID